MLWLRVHWQVLRDGIHGIRMYFFSSRKDRYGYFAKTANIQLPVWGAKTNVYIHDFCGINAGAKFISQKGKFVLMRNCSVGPNLTVITCNHKYDKVGQRPESGNWGELTADDVMVSEDVWIGANVTLCPGVRIGRGSIVAAGSVCVKSKRYPPYAIIGGNPAKFIKFRLTLDKQIEQEKLLYSEAEQLDKVELEQNYVRMTGMNNE